jgi:hypothetical protein
MSKQQSCPEDFPPIQGRFQVWHANSKDMLRCRKLGIGYDGGYTHVADVESTDSLSNVVSLTRHGRNAWPENPGVTALVIKPRSTRTGDVIVSPCGAVWRIEDDYYATVDHANPGRYAPVVNAAARIPAPVADPGSIDLTASIIEYESGTLDEAATVALFQHLVDTRIAGILQGHYGRVATDLLDAGMITRPESKDPVADVLESARGRCSAESPARALDDGLGR